MKIEWAKNPLETKVFLDEHEKRELRLRVEIDHLRSATVALHMALKNEEYRHLAESQYERVWDDGYTKDMDEEARELIQELETGKHIGDCTCIACSCFKCHAEAMADIDTMPGLGKHSAYKIDDACRSTDTLDETIEKLTNYEPKADWDGWEAHADRWKREAEEARIWLEEYKRQHFPNEGD